MDFLSQLSDPELLKPSGFVHGQWKASATGKSFGIQDPGTGKTFTTCASYDTSDVDSVVQSSAKAFQHYRKENPRSRAHKLLEWDRLIRENKEDLARILTYETGKPLAEAHGELEYALGFTWWFSGEAERVGGNVSIPAAPNRRVFVVKQPIGIAVALVPWNFPVAMILRKAAAALAAGCTFIAKPSPETPLSCLALAKLAADAGFSPGVFNVIPTSMENTPSVAEALCKHPLVKKVSFTGSTAIGSLIAKHCSEGLKKVSLELGGNCPFVVFDDCNQEQALEALFTLKWRHSGQACVTANRVYVQSGIYEEFLEKVVSRTKTLKQGHGLDLETTIGPLTTPRGVAKAQQHVDDAVSAGAKVVLGGKPATDVGEGFFFQPTVLRDATQDMLISREETFAPVLALYRFETEDEAVAMANNTEMGLASYFFTKNVDRSWRLLENLEAGMIGMNTGNSSAAESPFGGMKLSGYGKESGKDVAIEEYLVAKTGTFTVEDHF
ncbi:succinate-semialdehyde dehydrogenase [Fusarium oxysporum f. sp. radicis-lycopersici 26381]|nr:succinate-semialdehyde dehydrogenase [Fusarium oxysporum f. sp. radicis-lycopersici 26381]